MYLPILLNIFLYVLGSLLLPDIGKAELCDFRQLDDATSELAKLAREYRKPQNLAEMRSATKNIPKDQSQASHSLEWKDPAKLDLKESVQKGDIVAFRDDNGVIKFNYVNNPKTDFTKTVGGRSQKAVGVEGRMRNLEKPNSASFQSGYVADIEMKTLRPVPTSQKPPQLRTAPQRGEVRYLDDGKGNSFPVTLEKQTTNNTWIVCSPYLEKNCAEVSKRVFGEIKPVPSFLNSHEIKNDRIWYPGTSEIDTKVGATYRNGDIVTVTTREGKVTGIVKDASGQNSGPVLKVEVHKPNGVSSEERLYIRGQDIQVNRLKQIGEQGGTSAPPATGQVVHLDLGHSGVKVPGVITKVYPGNTVRIESPYLKDGFITLDPHHPSGLYQKIFTSP